jgi:hypothetical protein
MSDLSSFAQLMQAAAEEKRLRELAEKTRKVTEVAPLLSELFSTITKGKESKVEIAAKESPLLGELQEALLDPDKFRADRQDKKERILELVSDLESHAVEIQNKIQNTDSTETTKDTPTDLEKKFLKLFNRLHADFQTLKKYVENKQTSNISYGGSAGSGEVRILRMDDVVKGSVPQNGAVMTWNASLNKFEFKVPTTGGGAVSDEEMPYAKRIDFVSDNELYKGEALVGTTDNLPYWRIHKIIIGSDSDVTETWANGNADYDKVWADRSTYNYS